MPFNRRTFLTGLSLLMTVPSAAAQIRIPQARLDILTADVPTHRLEDHKLALANGRTFRLFRAVPKNTSSETGFPVLYMLDGNGAFDALTPELLAFCPGLVLIGVGYDTALRFDVNQRSLDYTPPVGSGGPVPDPDRPERMIGGADRFLAMLLSDIRQEAERDLPIDLARRYLWGHSYGGLFALYTLFSRPDAFAGYAAISPSVWWGEGLLVPPEEKATWPDSQRIPLLVALGDSEQRSNDNAPPPRGPAPKTMEMIERLRRKQALDIEAHVLEGLGHGATLAASLPLAFDWIMRKG